jgi:hypothetical protein
MKRKLFHATMALSSFTALVGAVSADLSWQARSRIMLAVADKTAARGHAAGISVRSMLLSYAAPSIKARLSQIVSVGIYAVPRCISAMSIQ